MFEHPVILKDFTFEKYALEVLWDASHLTAKVALGALAVLLTWDRLTRWYIRLRLRQRS